MSDITLRSIVWTVIALCLAVLGYMGLMVPRWNDRTDIVRPVTAESNAASLGGPFSMISHTGETVTEKTYAGKVWLMFMGFTNCPDICPTALAEISSWLEELGDEADEVRGFFVTVDPERDTDEVLRRYVSSFDDRIIALRPDPKELERFAKSYKINYKKIPTDGGGYTMDHTDDVLLFSKAGGFSGTIDLHEPKEIALRKIWRLVEEKGAQT